MSARARRRALRLAAGSVALAILLLGAPGVRAQAPNGVIVARIEVMTASAPAIDALGVQLIALDQEGGLTTQDATTSGAEVRFEVEADARISYVLRVVYDGVPYLTEPILLSPELPQADIEIPVFATTSEQPDLEVAASVITVLALDRTNAQLTLLREDRIENPSDRVYVGGDDGVTLRLPLPDGTVAADGVTEEGDFVVDGGVLTATLPLRPGSSLVVSRYVVGYDRAADAYDLRLTTPLPARQLELHVPERFVQQLRPLDGAERAADTEFEGERLRVVAVEGPVRPGTSVRATLDGLAGRNDPNPLTEQPGAAIAVGVAVVLVSATVLLLARITGRDEPSEPGGA